MKNKKEGFPPIADDRSTILILGSMPSEESLRKQEYYGHPRNGFWKIMGSLFGFDHVGSYKDRVNNLKNNNVALWDVMHTCERQGSLDSSIIDSTIAENDFETFFRDHPHINHVFFNGAKAEKEYLKRVLPELSIEETRMTYTRLPSTSPAMASLSFDEKLLEWSIIKRSKTNGA